MTTGNDRILIVDDDPNDLAVLVAILETDHDVLATTDAAEALDLARTARPDLILLDIMMPDMSGYEVCARLKADPDTVDLPVIFITCLSQAGDEARGLEAGAVDYVSKPIVPLVIRRRVQNHLHLKKARDRLAYLSITDDLTGLANRGRFDHVLDLECRRLSRTASGHLSLLLIDIDFFKTFNDTYGHPAGDRCLGAVAGAISGSVRRASDMAARFGGEEFACILPETDRLGAVAVAERIRSRVAALGIPCACGATGEVVTISIGVASTESGTVTSPTALLSAADAELYAAKSAGRNRVCVAPPPEPHTPARRATRP